MPVDEIGSLGGEKEGGARQSFTERIGLAVDSPYNQQDMLIHFDILVGISTSADPGDLYSLDVSLLP